ncbi:MAG: glycoside hydrolase [Halobacteriales archaeon]|nr:glycoside hydrolase [Halobacteriales archaeon]
MVPRSVLALAALALLVPAAALALTIGPAAPLLALAPGLEGATGSSAHALPRLATSVRPIAGGAAATVHAAMPSQAAIGSAPTFTVVDTHSTGPELGIGVSREGTIYVGGWDHVARSRDDGATWTALSPQPLLSVAADRVLIVDHDTGRVFVQDTDLACTVVDFSDDEGATWLNSPIACGGGVTDHQKIAVGPRTTYADPTGLLYPNVVYACANGLASANCGVSLDGGLSWLTTVPHGIGCAFQGAPVAGRDGTLYEPSSACGAQVRLTRDNGLSWVELDVGTAQASADTPDLAVSPDGTLYFAYTDTDWQPQLMRSADGGHTWQGPFALPVAGLTSSVFPVIVAGDDGRVGVAFYGTTDDAAGWDHNPGSAPGGIRWNGYVAVITDAASAAPGIAPVAVTDNSDPLQYGCLSKMGGCLDNIADYMDIDVGPDGRVYAVFTDGCRAGCHDHATSDASEAVVAVQTGGATLRA